MTYVNNSGEKGYLDLLHHILAYGTDKSDRTGVGTRSIFGAQLQFNLQVGFPLLTTKKVHPKSVFGELAWLIRGETNVFPLVRDGITIWNEWADERGDLGPIYGKQWRKWSSPVFDSGGMAIRFKEIDQLADAVKLIISDPDSRRIVVTAWNPAENHRMALTPCHAMFQFEVHDGMLSCHMYQRSADVFLGVPFNIASYAALTHFVAAITDLKVGQLIVSFGDVHIYNNHFDQVKEQLIRSPRGIPSLTIDPDYISKWKDPDFGYNIKSALDNVKLEHFILENYDPWPAIKAEVAV